LRRHRCTAANPRCGPLPGPAPPPTLIPSPA